MNIKIYQMYHPEDSTEYFYAAENKEDAKECFLDDEAVDPSIENEVVARELLETEMYFQFFQECDEDCTIHQMECPSIAFKERLENIISYGAKFPTFFAKGL
jgi:hypothetical protein